PLQHLRDHPEIISTWLPYNGLILAALCILTFLLRYYLIEPLARHLYGTRFSTLSPRNQRGVINHMVAGSIKLCIILVAAYPFFAVLIKRDFHYPAAPGSKVRLGDLMVVVVDMVSAMYVFELFYRETVSPIGVFHHVGAIIIAQTSVVLGLDEAHRVDAQIEFALVLLWGVFDVVAEFWPHLAMLIYRYRPDAHRKNATLFLSTAYTELVGSTVETALVMTLFGSLWDQWTIAFKISTPILHALFTGAQLWNARVFWGLYKSKKAAAARERKGGREEGKIDGEPKEEGGMQGILGGASVEVGSINEQRRD
ncbi:hypothetical protein BDZ85DRAFT_270879, partial [Elsinoe ampelina]